MRTSTAGQHDRSQHPGGMNHWAAENVAGRQAPEYLLERDPNADEHGSTCLLRFTAGPPYEDVYFKILNKEWGGAPTALDPC